MHSLLRFNLSIISTSSRGHFEIGQGHYKATRGDFRLVRSVLKLFDEILESFRGHQGPLGVSQGHPEVIPR